jgi:hypothetical protein
MDRMQQHLTALIAATAGCRLDMHEPDEAGVRAHVIGDHLDNAMGNRIVENLLLHKAHEFLVIIKREDNLDPLAFNLADLIALARLAVIPTDHEIPLAELRAMYTQLREAVASIAGYQTNLEAERSGLVQLIMLFQNVAQQSLEATVPL